MNRDIAVVVGTLLLSAVVIVSDLYQAGTFELLFDRPPVHIVRAAP